MGKGEGHPLCLRGGVSPVGTGVASPVGKGEGHPLLEGGRG